MQEPEVTASDPRNGSDGLGISEVGVVEGEAEPAPVACEHEGQLVTLQGTVMVCEAHAAEQLRVARQTLFQAGHADQDDADTRAIEDVADQLNGRGWQSFAFVDDQNLDELAPVANARRAAVGLRMFLDADADPNHVLAERIPQAAQSAEHRWCVEHRAPAPRALRHRPGHGGPSLRSMVRPSPSWRSDGPTASCLHRRGRSTGRCSGACARRWRIRRSGGAPLWQ